MCSSIGGGNAGGAGANKHIDVKLSKDQVNRVKAIEAKTRYDAMDQVAKILNATTGQRGTWASSRKTIIIDKNTHADITYKKGKVTQIEYFDNKHEKFYNPFKIK